MEFTSIVRKGDYVFFETRPTLSHEVVQMVRTEMNGRTLSEDLKEDNFDEEEGRLVMSTEVAEQYASESQIKVLKECLQEAYVEVHESKERAAAKLNSLEARLRKAAGL